MKNNLDCFIKVLNSKGVLFLKYIVCFVKSNVKDDLSILKITFLEFLKTIPLIEFCYFSYNSNFSNNMTLNVNVEVVDFMKKINDAKFYLLDVLNNKNKIVYDFQLFFMILNTIKECSCNNNKYGHFLNNNDND